MADSDALRAKRYRRHQQGVHDLCRGDCVRLTLLPATEPGSPGLVPAMEREFENADSTIRAMAARLAVIADTTTGPGATQAIRALAELVTATRADSSRRPRSVS